jgi:hypothetical protein
MRTIFSAVATLLVFGLVVVLPALPGKEDEGVKVRLRLVDDSTGKDMAGIVRLFAKESDVPLSVPNLFNRLRGLEEGEKARWYVVPSGGKETTLPRAALRLEAVSGLDTALLRQDVDLTKGGVTEITARLKTLIRPQERNWVAGNTHLHLRNFTLAEADTYLRQIPPADGLKVLFLSYLERDKDDRTYVSNRYPVGPLVGFETTGVLLSNGEEHRHNFEAYGQGYGHVMFLDIKQLVKPVSLGPGITGGGNDDRPLRPGLDDARQQMGTVLWCHNTSGYEAVPSALAGRFHALNVFDGSRGGTYEERYYRLLNIGLRVPISTGTDWFLYDFARVYVRVPERLTIPAWLESLRAGRSVVTNGSMLSLTVDGRDIGEVVALERPGTVKIEATAKGRLDFDRLQLIQNGKVIHTQASEKQEGGHAARLVREVRIDEPAWFTVRIDSQTKNELDQRLFAHTSPVYVDLAGKRAFDVESARSLQQELETARDTITRRGQFSSDGARDKVLALYEEALKEVVQRINQRGK